MLGLFLKFAGLRYCGPVKKSVGLAPTIRNAKREKDVAASSSKLSEADTGREMCKLLRRQCRSLPISMQSLSQSFHSLRQALGPKGPAFLHTIRRGSKH